MLLELHTTLKSGGVLFSSNPRGRNEESWNSGRYGVYHDLEGWSRYTSAAGFVEITHYYRIHGMPREQQPWLASIMAQIGALTYITSIGCGFSSVEQGCDRRDKGQK